MIGHVKCIERFKKLVADFRALTIKVQKYKTLKETNLVLEVCKKEYSKLYLEHENLKNKKKKRKYKEQ